GSPTEVQGWIARRDGLKMGTVRVNDPCRDPMPFRGRPRHHDLGAVGREAWAFPEIAKLAYVGAVGGSRQDGQLTVVLPFANEHDLAVKVRRPGRGGLRAPRTAAHHQDDEDHRNHHSYHHGKPFVHDFLLVSRLLSARDETGLFRRTLSVRRQPIVPPAPPIIPIRSSPWPARFLLLHGPP